MAGRKKAKANVEGQDWDLVVAGLGKKFGDGLSLFKMDQENINMLSVDPIPTYLVSLDEALGIFGFPIGRIVEIFGPESGGKTSIALQVVVAAQKLFPDRPIVYVDLEHALDPIWMKIIGVDLDNLWIAQPDSGEQATQIILTAIESGQPSLVILDSVAAMASQAEIDGEMTDNQMGVIARMMGKFCRKVIGPLKKHGTTLICVNQVRSKLGPVPGEERPGGKALRFFASQILRVRKDTNIVVGGDTLGVWIEIIIKKNKVAPPFKVATIPLLFHRGFSPEMCLVEAASREGIINKSGTWYSYNDIRLGQGVVNAAESLTPELFDEIYDAYKASKMINIKFIDQPEEQEVPELEEEVSEENV